MTAKCLFCKDTKIEPGIPGPCIWCEEIGPATTGAVERFTIAKLRYAGGAEHDVRYVSEAHYDAALGREAALREELESIKASVDGYDSPEHAAQVADEMGYQCIALQQRLTVAEQDNERLRSQIGREKLIFDMSADELVKDAARYRWLMSGAVMNGTLGICGGWIDFEFKGEAAQQIDEAMQQDAKAAEGEGS